MSKTPDQDEVDVQAADWVARLHSDTADEADWLALETWLAADTRHLAAYDQAERLWAGLEDAAILSAVAPEASASVIDFTARRARKAAPRWLAPFAGVAAAAVVAVVIGPSLLPAKAEIFETAPGETRELVLSDGSRVSLNGASHLEARMARGERRLTLRHAEAAFDVTHDPARPFIIDAGEISVRVIGTEFNVSQEADGATVTVRRGIVQVAETANPGHAVRVTVGEQVAHSAGAQGLRVQAANADAAFAWRQRRLVYSDATLAEVTADLSRAFATPIRVEGEARDIPFSGVLVLDDPEAVTQRLEAFLPITAHRAEQGITLSSR